MRLGRTPRTFIGLGVVLLMAVLTLAGCGGGGSGSSSAGNVGKGVKITVGSKKDADGQLLGSMYALLLQHAGYDVTTKIPLGTTPVLDSAIKSGAVDLYPEFTGTAATVNNLPLTQDQQQLYQSVKDYYESKYQITWLDPAYGLNDSYGICTSQAVKSKYNLTSLDDLAKVANQLTLATPQDGVDAAEKPVEKGYNVTFKNVTQIDEQLGFGAVTGGQADVNVCYTTDPTIVTDNFVVLKDTKNVFPIYNPAPIVRDPKLKESPAIASVLSPLEAKLTTDVIVKLIKQVSVDKKQPSEVAQQFLKDQGLI